MKALAHRFMNLGKPENTAWQMRCDGCKKNVRRARTLSVNRTGLLACDDCAEELKLVIQSKSFRNMIRAANVFL